MGAGRRDALCKRLPSGPPDEDDLGTGRLSYTDWNRSRAVRVEFRGADQDEVRRATVHSSTVAGRFGNDRLMSLLRQVLTVVVACGAFGVASDDFEGRNHGRTLSFREGNARRHRADYETSGAVYDGGRGETCREPEECLVGKPWLRGSQPYPYACREVGAFPAIPQRPYRSWSSQKPGSSRSLSG